MGVFRLWRQSRFPLASTQKGEFMTHRISRLPFLGEERLVSVDGVRGFKAQDVFGRCLKDDWRFTAAALEAQFGTILESTNFATEVDPVTLIVADVQGEKIPVNQPERFSRFYPGVHLAHLVELLARQPDGLPLGPLDVSMWGTACILRDKPDVAVIVRWWDPTKVVFTLAYGEADYGPKTGYVFDAVPSKDILKWMIRGARVVFPF